MPSRKTDITSIKSNSKKSWTCKTFKLSQIQPFFSVAPEKKSWGKEEQALLFLLCVSACWLKMLLCTFRKSQCVDKKQFMFYASWHDFGSRAEMYEGAKRAVLLQLIVAEGYSSSFFSLVFFLELARKKSDTTTIKFNSKKLLTCKTQ